MPRLKRVLPKYSLHKASGQAYVKLDGQRVYLGAYDSQVSRANYDQVVASWIANGRRIPAEWLSEDRRRDLRVVELIAAYLEFAEQYYRRPDGRPTSEHNTLLQALKPLHALHGHTAAAGFGPLALKAVREKMIDRGWARSHINKQVSRIKQMFKWAVENEMVPAETYQALLAVAGLKRGRCAARESEPVKPVPEEQIEPVLELVSDEVGGLIRLQLLTGMRPGEAVIMRRCDIDMSGPIWVYTPMRHKTEHYGIERRIYLGPKAQAVLEPFLKPRLDAFLFSPQDAEARRRDAMHSRRRTPLSCGNRPGKSKRRRPRVSPRERYDVASYRRAIQRACDKAFPPPEHLRQVRAPWGKGQRWETNAEWKERLGSDGWAELEAWRARHRWHPHQLRHNAATRLRKQFGIEAARVILGHSSAAITEVYAELDHAKAAEIMGRIG